MSGSGGRNLQQRMSETARGRAPEVVVIDGEIGAGKTTLIELLRDGLTARGHRVAVVPEPVDEWKKIGILQMFYEDKPDEVRSHVAYDFQTYTFVTRIKKTLEVVEAEPDADIYLLERSVLTDRYVFMELQRELVGERLMQMYDEWWEMWERLMPFRPTRGVYLKPTLDNCMSRVASRAREGEIVRRRGGDSARDDRPPQKTAAAKGAGGVSAEYQARLRRAHEAYLEGRHREEFPGMPPHLLAPDAVTIVEGGLADADFSVPGPAASAVVTHIIERLGLTHPR